jgi:hypothetical protein
MLSIDRKAHSTRTLKSILKVYTTSPRLLYGDFAYGFHRFLSPARAGESVYLSVVRHPLASVLARYENAKLAGSTLSPEDWLLLQPTNVMTSYFAGFPPSGAEMHSDSPPACPASSIQLARYHLRSRFKFVGLFEEPDDTFRVLAALLDRPLVDENLYRSAVLPPHSLTTLPESLRDRILQSNALDVELYDLLERQFRDDMARLEPYLPLPTRHA